MLGIKYLSEAHLKGFERYKYNSIDTSVLSVYIMHPFWNKCVKLVPMWVAPNVLTFAGFLLTIVNFVIIGYYDWDFKAADDEHNPIPLWIWLVASINIFVAYTLDGIDGKQARRTGTSGPLGELFDHGLDSYSAVLIPIYMFSLFGRIDLPPIRMFFVIWNVFLNFYLTHVEKYITGVMFLPWAYDFTMWGVALTLLVTFLFGPTMWRMRLPFGLSTANAFEILLIVSGIISSHPIIIKNIHNSYKNRTGKMRPFMEAARPLFAFLWLFVITLTWVWFSTNNILDLEPRILFVLFGTLFSNISCRLIVAQMSDTRCDGFNILMWPLCVVTLISCFPFYEHIGLPELTSDMERWITYALTIFTSIAHIHYGQGVVREMCDHFHIKCFKDRYMVLLNTLSSNHERLIAALHLLDYSKKRLLNGYVSSLRTTVNKFVEEINLDLKRTLDSKTVFFHLPKEDAAKFEIEYPEGITFKSLGEEHAALVNEEWPFHHEGSLFFVRRLIKLNPSIGAFTKDNEPIAWCLRLQIGSLGLLQVRETHKRKGFGSIIVKVMSQVLAKMDCDIVAPVVEENFASRSLFEKLGFKIIDNLFWSIVENDTSTAWKDEDDL